MKEIINQKPDQRLQTLRKAFGIEDYKTAAENAKLVLNEFKNKKEYLSGKLERINEIEDEIKELNETSDILENELEDLILKNMDASEKFEKIKENVEEVRELKANKHSVESELMVIETAKKNTRKSAIEYENEIKEDKNYRDKIILKRIKELKTRIKGVS